MCRRIAKQQCPAAWSECTRARCKFDIALIVNFVTTLLGTGVSCLHTLSTLAAGFYAAYIELHQRLQHCTFANCPQTKQAATNGKKHIYICVAQCTFQQTRSSIRKETLFSSTIIADIHSCTYVSACRTHTRVGHACPGVSHRALAVSWSPTRLGLGCFPTLHACTYRLFALSKAYYSTCTTPEQAEEFLGRCPGIYQQYSLVKRRRVAQGVRHCAG